MMAKDYFSEQSSGYALYRPSWPADLIASILTHCPGRDRAWDCATGNGQVATLLADHFNQVDATDISARQLAEAVARPNIHYALAPAEDTPFPDHVFDLITVGQAVHWFEHERFYREVERVLKPDGLLALLGYGLARITPEIDAIVDELYTDVLGPYWHPERKYIDEHYKCIPFPFRELHFPDLEHLLTWRVDHLLGYVNTWSAVRQYIQLDGVDPVEPFDAQLRQLWGTSERAVHIPVFSRVGRLV
ncbi:MAG: class I SAM-dependent methyltransferase [Saprospiraceae bacterium]|nr:class I SAM-dependent methyltransferase [Saprospiraceae bacterium]